jgi:hypothetical protein
MKRILIILVILLSVSVVSAAPFLACDLPEAGVTITQVKVEITRNPGASQTVTEVAGTTTIQGVNFILYDLAGLTAGKYSFRAKWADSSGLWSEYSDPLVLGKPTRPSILRVIP